MDDDVDAMAESGRNATSIIHFGPFFYVVSCFLGFSSGSHPGDDVLCSLLFHARFLRLLSLFFVFVCFLFYSDRVRSRFVLV